MSKGSKTRPTDKIAYDTNYERIFGRKYTAQEAWETCPYCGIKVENPCDSLPANLCDKAVNIVHGQWLNDINTK